MADAKTEEPLFSALEIAEETLAPPPEVAEARAEEAAPRAELRRAPPADVADAMAAPPRERPSLRADSPAARADEMSAPWAETRERMARKARLVNCIFA